MNQRDLDWLAGLLEGEGSFMAPSPSKPNSPTVSVHMTDRDVVERVAKLFGVAMVVPTPPAPPRKPTYHAKVRGSRAAELMQRLRPLLGQRRQAQIDKALAAYVPRPPGQHASRTYYDRKEH